MYRKLKKLSSLSILFFIALNLFVSAWGQNEKKDFKEIIACGNGYYSKGDFNNAILFWNQALNKIDSKIDSNVYISTLVHIANGYMALGYYKKGLNILENGIPVAEKCKDRGEKALFYSSLGDIYFVLENMEKAETYMSKALDESNELNDPDISASIFNNLGNIFAATEDYEGAQKAYERCLELLEDTDLPELNTKLLINIVHLSIINNKYSEVGNSLEDLLSEIEDLEDSYYKVSSYIEVYKLIKQILGTVKPIKKETLNFLLKVSYEILDITRKISTEIKDNRSLSYALGYMGELYEDKKRYNEAMILTRQAVFFAQQGNNPEILYLWEWQLARLYKITGDRNNAIKLFEKSIQTLNPIRNEMFIGRRLPHDVFNEAVKPVYLGLTELLLDLAEATPDKKIKTEKLLAARDTMEMLKTAELENFFKDECITSKQGDALLTQAPAHTALLHPIPLKDKLALLVTLPGGIEYISVPVKLNIVQETVAHYRMALQTRPNNRFLYDSQKVYNWTIRPLEKMFKREKIDTLAVAPDGPLRLIPFSTLHDGKHFLIEKYAVATIPALRLTDPSNEINNLHKILMGGLSEGRQGFSPLPGVPAELRDIKKIMDGKILLKDNEYTITNLTREFKDSEYSIVHIATHGVFGGTPQESFLLTYDSKLTMDLLENLIGLSKYRERKVELLTLSACQTALGNERAAMGLAGAAVKAGVKAVIATLWFVDDEATSMAIREFYRQLTKAGMTKAKAMQNVQKKLISQKRFWHPLYWAPFLVIGNWM